MEPLDRRRLLLQALTALGMATALTACGDNEDDDDDDEGDD